jgi:hypothetical protein
LLQRHETDKASWWLSAREIVLDLVVQPMSMCVDVFADIAAVIGAV